MPRHKTDNNKFLLTGRASYSRTIFDGETKKNDKTGKLSTNYAMNLIVPKASIDHVELFTWLREQAIKHYGPQSKDVLTLKPNYCSIMDGDTWADSQGNPQVTKHPEYKDAWVVKLSMYRAPDIRNKRRETLTDHSGDYYDGGDCCVCLSTAASEYNGRKYLRLEPGSILAYGRGEPFASGTRHNADEDFAEEFDDDFDDAVAGATGGAAPSAVEGDEF